MKDRLLNIIPPNDCVADSLYRIYGRINNLGICVKTDKPKEEVQFLVERWKFGFRHLWPEIHWDCDDRYGTAQPVLLIEAVPPSILSIIKNPNRVSFEEQQVLDYLANHPFKKIIDKR